MKALLSSYREDAIRAIETMALADSAENVKAAAAMLKTQLGLTKLFLELPDYVKKASQAIDHDRQKKQAFADAQESASIGAADRRTN
ncbi:MAG: hypothetical protein P4L77_11955 [Sulfuriferula sp.]|nr:hypothetical protein [Sulfuriferula sp.]